MGCECSRAVLVALLVLSLARPAAMQQASSFVPSGLPALFENVTARLVYRENGLGINWKDPTVRAVYVADRIVLDPDFWRREFQETGGVAVLGPTRPAGSNFTITSGNTSETSRPEINFRAMPSAMLVEPGGRLLFNNVLIADIAGVDSYVYEPSQPYRNQGLGWALWPSIAMANGALVYLLNVSVAYVNPVALDTCQQYTAKAVFGMRQAFGAENVTLLNATASRIIGPVNVTVLVTNGSTNATVGTGTAFFDNVTFACLEHPAVSSPATGLAPGALAVAIAVPIAVAVAACLLACCCIRRRNLRRRRAARLAAAAAAADSNKDLEASLQPAPSRDIGSVRDQNPQDRQLGRASAGLSNGPSNSSASTIRNFLAIPADTPFMEGILGTAYSTGGSSGGNSARRLRQGAAGAPGSAGSSVLTPVGSMPLAVVPSSSRNSRDRPNNSSGGGRWGPTPSTQSSALQRLSIDTHVTAAGLAQAGSSAAGTESSSMGPLLTGGSGSGQSGGTASGGAGSSGGQTKQTVAERYAGVASLIKARSDIAVLRELKIGPLLGRGSYGRVYRGRWKATTVAVKIIEHVAGTPGTASSGGKKISVGRESMLATSISHPNVIQTYHISTMTVAQRSALANTWLTDGSGAAASGSPAPGAGQQQPREHADHSGSDDDNSGHGSTEGLQKDLMETWMLMELAEKGSLERALNAGRFVRKADKEPEMVGIYKALLDTASGLDYLHSIGVVHGDLKTANVLLKGSAKDPRGFICKITDFGLSRVLDLDATHISTATYGTIVYMPKELLLSGRMTQATDIYSFGLMMWELFTSSRVFDEGLSIGQMFYMIAYQDWRPEVPPDCPSGYAELMAACWHDDPEQRPTAQQLLPRLQRLYVQAKQELAATKGAEAAAAAAGAAAAADVQAGGPSSADSETTSAGAAAAGPSQDAAAALATSKQQRRPKAASPPPSATAGAAGHGSSSSMVDSVMGTLSPGASGGQVGGSGGLASPGLGLSGLTVSGGSAGAKADSADDGDDGVWKPYAAAVLQRKRSGSLATGGSGSGLFSTAQRSAGRGARPGAGAGAGAAGAAGGAAGARPYSAFAVGSGGTQPTGSSEIEAFDDALASETLLQADFTTSSGNVQDAGGDEGTDGANEFSGYLAEEGPAGSPPLQRGVGAARGAAADAAGLVSSIELSCRSRGAAPAADDAGGGRAAAALAAEGPGDSSFQDSFSTSSMPSVVADSWLGSQSSRSFGGGSQLSGRFTSSMTLGSLPPQSPPHPSSGASVGAPPNPDSNSPYQQLQQQPVSAFQAAAGVGAPASPTSFSHGMLQTVHEGSGSGPLEVVSTSPPASPDAATKAPTGELQQPPPAALQAPPAGAPASPFAALAQRAGSLFGPLKM